MFFVVGKYVIHNFSATQRLIILWQRGSGNWEVSVNSELVASGCLRAVDPTLDKIDDELSENNFDIVKNISDFSYEESDVYNIFEDCGCIHKDSFCTIKQINLCNQGKPIFLKFFSWVDLLTFN